jgi:hypothetical protein
MLRRFAVVSTLALASTCSMLQSPPPAQETKMKEMREQVRITNQQPFDVAACHPRKLQLSQPVNSSMLVGALVSLRPQVMECLVDPKHRGPEKTTRVLITSRVDESAGKHTLTGENLTPEGQQCIQQVADTSVPLAPQPKGARVAEETVDFVHDKENSISVEMGVNEGSDFAGLVRLGQPQWCDCYAAFADKTPPILSAKVRLAKDQPKPKQVSIEPVGTPEGDALAACLQQKIAELPAQISTTELGFTQTLIHLNAQAAEPAPDATPELRFFHLELARGQRNADTALAIGERASAAAVYDDLVVRYNKNKSSKMVAELEARCKVLVDASQRWVSSVESQLKVEQASLALVQELSAKDATSWANVAPKSQEMVDLTKKDLATAQATLEADKKVCPKKR